VRVLVVDDDPEFVSILGARLAARGHSCDAVGSAFGLVNHVAGRGEGAAVARPDVVVLDCMLPGLSGGAALAMLAKDARAREVPVVVVSAVSTAIPWTGVGAHGRARARVKDGRFGHLVEAIEAVVCDEAIAAD
jgi:two-component system, NtrC family, response regulator